MWFTVQLDIVLAMRTNFEKKWWYINSYLGIFRANQTGRPQTNTINIDA